MTVEALEDRRLLASGAILGTVFEDLTGNGISPDDPTIAQRGVTLFRDNGDGTLNAATDIQVARDQSRKDGRYEFRQLSAGTYFVQQDLPLGWADLEAEVHDDVLTPAQVSVAPPERNDTLATAVATGLNSATPGRYVARGAIGDNKKVDARFDVDLFRLQLNAGDRVVIDVDAEAFGSSLDAMLRLFDASGIQVTANDEPAGESLDPRLEYVARTSGTYYVGVSGFANGEYNPAVEGSGNPSLSSSTGEYTLEINVGPRPAVGKPAVVTLAAGEQRSGVDLVSSRLGSLAGQMYEDLDGDGVQDPDEPGQDGQVVLLIDSGTVVSFTTTRSIDVNRDGRINPATESGLYSFDDLTPGIYFTSGLASFGLGPAGWLQTSPSMDRAEVPRVGTVSSGPGSDPGIPGLLPDLTVDLDNGLFDWFVADGQLHFGQATPNIGLGPMELRAGPDLGNGTQLVFQRIYQDPGLTTFIDREAGTFTFHPEHNHIHFNDYASFSVRLALPDADGDGLPELGPVVAGGLKTSFCLVDVAPYDLSLPNAAQEPSGFGCGGVQRISVGWMDIYNPLTPGQQIDVSQLAAGQYWLEAVVDPTNALAESNENNNVARSLITLGLGAPTAPVGQHAVGLHSGQAVPDLDFGNFRLITISGQVYDDRNGDGQQASNEKGLGGRTVFLDLNGDGVLNNPEGDGVASALATEPWALTDQHGNYVLQGIGPGTYQVRQVLPSGWSQTTADPAPIEARSGQNVTGIDFGNVQSSLTGLLATGSTAGTASGNTLSPTGGASFTPPLPGQQPALSPHSADRFWAALGRSARTLRHTAPQGASLDDPLAGDPLGSDLDGCGCGT